MNSFSAGTTTGPQPALQPASLQQSAWQLLADAPGSDAWFQAWLMLQAGMVTGARRAVLVLGAPDTGPFAPVALWPAAEAVDPALAEAAERVLAERQPLVIPAGSNAVLAYPLMLSGHLHGLVVLEAAGLDDAGLQQAMRALQWGLAGLEAALVKRQSVEEEATRERLIATLDLIASTIGEQGYVPAAQALVTDLAIRLDCDRVSFGMQRNLNCQVVAMSHSADFGKRINLVRAIGLAMDEAIDQKAVIVLPAGSESNLVTRDHAALARQHGSDAVLTVPFVTTDGPSGAFCFERPGNRPFTEADIELCQAVTAMCCRMLDEKRRNDRSLPLRVTDALRTQATRLVGPRYAGRKLLAVLVLLAVAFFSVFEMNYRVAATASLEGFVRRVLVAPYDGYIAGARFRAGDIVAEGDVIAILDDRDLRLDYLKWASQQAQYARQYQDAAGQRERAQANIVQAQIQQAQAQMDLLAEQIGRARIKAPFAGVIVSGDLSQSLGGAVKRGDVLFEIAPLSRYRVVLEVDEAEIANLKVGQKGEMLLTALPGEVIPLTTLQMTPVTSSREGKTFFRVEAVLDRGRDELRPGMEGVAKVETGPRKLIWIWTHRLVDWLRLTLWSWI